MENKSQIHWLSVGLAYSTLFILGLADNLRGPLFPDVMRDLHLTDTQGSWLWGLASIFAFVGSSIAPRMMKGRGLVGTLKASLLIMALGQLGMAFSERFELSLLCSVFFGTSLGLLGVVQNLLVLQAGPPEAIQRLQAGLHSNYAGASVLAPLLLAGVAFFTPDWRVGYMVGSFITFGGFAALFRVSAQTLEAHHEQKVAVADSQSFFPLARVLWVSGPFALYVVLEIMISSRLALFLRRDANFDFQASSLATTLFFVGLFAGRFLFIFWQPKFRLKLQMMACLFVTMLLLILALTHDPRWIVLSGISMAPFYPLSMSYMAERFPHHLGRVMTIAISMNGFCVVAMHLAIGALTENAGIRAALIMGPIVAGVALLMLAADRKTT